ncbi:hypothetical protein KEM52_003160 [Ascosphaera acerosa]|nr:hypothetical protein KEM52_003160 [Ascosphaera acerosa]
MQTASAAGDSTSDQQWHTSTVGKRSKRQLMPATVDSMTHLFSLLLQHANKYHRPPRFSYHDRVNSMYASIKTPISDLERVAPQTICPWLHPGLTFTGHQHALHVIREDEFSATRHSGLGPQFGERLRQVALARERDEALWLGEHSDPDEGPQHAGPAAGASNNLRNSIKKVESWPVKVTLHSVDFVNNTIGGTMEARDIPGREVAEGDDGRIVTYLEGEIIDFLKNTFLTESYVSLADLDATYWHSMKPFRDMDDEEMARKILDEDWVREELQEKYLLMRWKGTDFNDPPTAEPDSPDGGAPMDEDREIERELLTLTQERFFISPSHERQGLSINGFYYIVLRRSDGNIQGMYFDWGNSPYQFLSLDPRTSEEKLAMFPSYQVR